MFHISIGEAWSFVWGAKPTGLVWRPGNGSCLWRHTSVVARILRET